MPNNAPIYKGNFGGVSVAAWADSATVQKRKPKDTNNPKGEWFTVGEIKGLNKTQMLELAKLLKLAAAEMNEPKPFKPAKASKPSNDDDE